MPGSPAIDQGNSGDGIDQRGGARPFDRTAIANAGGGDGSDIGAFEAGSFSWITSIRKVADDIHVSFTTDLGNSYDLQRRDLVTSGPWTTVVNNVNGTGSILTRTNSRVADLSQGFYRIQSVP